MTRRSSWGKKGSVYFILDEKARAIKIGFSTNVPERLATLQTATANKLELLGTMPGSVYDEQRLHGRFRRIHGEWFAVADDLWDFITNHTQTTPVFSTMRLGPADPSQPSPSVAVNQNPELFPSKGAISHMLATVYLIILLMGVAHNVLVNILAPIIFDAVPFLRISDFSLTGLYLVICLWALTHKYRDELEPIPPLKPRVDRQTRLKQKWEQG